MFENTIVDNLYNKIQKFQILSAKYNTINDFFLVICFFLSVFSCIAGIMFKQIINIYIMCIVVPIVIGFLSLSVPKVFKKLSKKYELGKVYEELISNLSQSKVQLELINFFDSIKVDNRYLQVQFSTQNYEVAITELSTLLANKIYADKMQKEAIKQQELIHNYQKQLKAAEKPKLRLIK